MYDHRRRRCGLLSVIALSTLVFFGYVANANAQAPASIIFVETPVDPIIVPGSENRIRARVLDSNGKTIGGASVRWELMDGGSAFVALANQDDDGSIILIGRAKEKLAAERPRSIHLKARYGSIEAHIYIPYSGDEQRTGANEQGIAVIKLEVPENKQLSAPGDVVTVTATLTDAAGAKLIKRKVNVEWELTDRDAQRFVRIARPEVQQTDDNGQISVDIVALKTGQEVPIPSSFYVKGRAGKDVIDIVPVKYVSSERSLEILKADYAVIGDATTKELFGRNVRDRYCAVWVNIRNESEREYQISSITFKSKDGREIGMVSYEGVAALQERRKLINARTLLLTGIAALGNLMTGFNPFFVNVARQNRFTTFTNILTVPGRNAVDSVFPNTVPMESSNLQSLALRRSLTDPNRASGYVFLPKEMMKMGETKDKSESESKDVCFNEKLADVAVRGTAVNRPQKLN